MTTARKNGIPHLYDIPIELCRSTIMFRITNNVRETDNSLRRTPRCLEDENEIELNFKRLDQQRKQLSLIPPQPPAFFTSGEQQRLPLSIGKVLLIVLLAIAC